jgi:hypothetical protein
MTMLTNSIAAAPQELRCLREGWECLRQAIPGRKSLKLRLCADFDSLLMVPAISLAPSGSESGGVDSISGVIIDFRFQES